MNAADPTADPVTTDAAPTSPAARRDPHAVLRHRLSVDGLGVPIIGGGFLLAVLLLTATVSLVTEVRISGWEVGTQLIRWFVGAIGVYLTGIYLPLYIAHGRTRREVAGDLAIFAALYAVFVAVLVAVGFSVERLVYRIAGWTQGIESLHLFDAADQYHLILAEHVIVLAVWVTAGAMLGAAYYRNGGIGLALTPVALVAVMVIEEGTAPGDFRPLPTPLLELIGVELGAFSPLGAAAIAVGSCVVMAAIAWRIVRDLPVRPETA